VPETSVIIFEKIKDLQVDNFATNTQFDDEKQQGVNFRPISLA